MLQYVVNQPKLESLLRGHELVPLHAGTRYRTLGAFINDVTLIGDEGFTHFSEGVREIAILWVIHK